MTGPRNRDSPCPERHAARRHVRRVAPAPRGTKGAPEAAAALATAPVGAPLEAAPPAAGSGAPDVRTGAGSASSRPLLRALVVVAVAVLVPVTVLWAVDRDAPELTWSPPALSDPVTYRVSGDGPGTIRAEAGQDSIVVFDGPVHRRIRMDGGRHWVVRGGEVVNDKQWSDIDDQSGLEFENVTGTAFVEGVLIHGRYGKDGIRIGEGGSDTTLVVQNTRITQRLAGPSDYHADVIQAYGGVEALKVDRLTGSGDYQGQMWKQEPGTTFGPTDFRRVNFRAASPEREYMINLVMSSPTAPVRLHEVYSSPDPEFAGGDFCRAQIPSESATCATDADGRQYVTWSDTPIDVRGRITSGVPPGGDFVPVGVAGLDYESPGYS